MRFVLLTTAVALGVLFAVGSVLAALFELQGFGAPRDDEPRLGYLALLALAFIASVSLPMLLWRRLWPGRTPSLLVAFAVSAAGVIVILGPALRT